MKKYYNQSEPGMFDSYTGIAQSSRDTLTLEKLSTVICKLRLNRARPLALWFVDRPAEYIQLLKQFDPIKEDWAVTSWPPRFYGIPIRQFTTSIATEEECATYPIYCFCPGVWIEISDGNHILLGETK